jgi:hypothetical protein
MKKVILSILVASSVVLTSCNSSASSEEVAKTDSTMVKDCCVDSTKVSVDSVSTATVDSTVTK